jgi:hypothetical protein
MERFKQLKPFGIYFFVILMTFLSISACAKSYNFSQSKNRSTVPAKYSSALDLLEYMQSVVIGGYPLPYGVDDKRWDAVKVSSFISNNGLTLYDVNNESTVKYSSRSLKNQLSVKKGKAYDSIVHMGLIYSQPYSQYSKLTYQPIQNGIVINMADWYRLTYVFEENSLRLSKLEYLTVEGD